MSHISREVTDFCDENTLRSERIRAARELAELSLEDVPDRDVLARQLAASNELPN